jgi:hypothetical protein
MNAKKMISSMVTLALAEYVAATLLPAALNALAEYSFFEFWERIEPLGGDFV